MVFGFYPDNGMAGESYIYGARPRYTSMVTLDKIAHLALESRFDSTGETMGGPAVSSLPGSFIGDVSLSKVRTLGDGTKHDVCASTASNRQVRGLDRVGNVASCGICHSYTHDGRCVSLFKTLFTNSCSHECGYCSNASVCKSGSKAFSYTPEELAKVTMALYRGNYIEGLFLSSGVGRDEDVLMERMLESLELLRKRHRFQGYVHMKILPGSHREHIKQSLEMADRVSINIEAPTRSYLSEISPSKDFTNDIILRQRYIREMAGKIKHSAGQTTQYVVGCAGETDRDIFDSMLREYRRMKMKRTYFSAFTPVEGTAMERSAQQPLWREHRLYQLDWLHRVYDFSDREIEFSFDDEGFLSNADPKLAIAREYHDSPVDPNCAGYDELLRVPGIGPKSAYRILNLRQREKITKKEQLKNLGVVLKRATPFLEINGWHETTLDRWLR
jgi:putative DNA modification/repair radical SAM protein